MNLETLTDSLVLHEGWRPTPYLDTVGKWTVGVGHNMERPLSDAAIKQILSDDINDCVADLDREKPTWRDHSDGRQNVLVEMCFNLGCPRLMKFTRMWEALEARNYDRAAYEMLNSNWAAQVGKRAERLAQTMKEGA